MNKSFIDQKRDWIFLLVLAGLLLAVRLPSFAEPLENDSGSVAFLARQMLKGTILYGVFHPAHHLPAVYYTFELAFRIFGDHANAPKVLLFFWTLICVLLLYFMGRMFFDQQTSIVSALFFVLISSQRGFAGQTVEMEQFANLPLIAGIFLLISLFHRKAPSWQFLWLGILGAISILYKVTFVAPIVVAPIAILLAAWINREEAGAWKTMFSRLVWLTIGLIIPLASVAVYFARLGLWKRLLLVFQLGSSYFDAGVMDFSYLPPPFGYPFFWISLNNFPLLLFGLIGAYHLVRRSIHLRTVNDLTDMILVLWLVLSFAMAGLRGGGFAHYCLPVIPPLALIASIAIHKIHPWSKMSSERFVKLGRSTAIASVVLLFLWSNYNLYRNYAIYKLGRISHDQFLEETYQDGFVSQQISNYLQLHTSPDDFVYLWSLHVDVYYYADRRPPIDILWPAYVGATGSPNRIFNTRTKYIVVDMPKAGSLPQWLMDGLKHNYYLETTIGSQEIYRLRAQ